MPYSPDGDSDFKGKLPNPKLNPMTNPTLGRNLGRWAQVYFTTPPEKREEAVVELLRELEAKSEIHKDGLEVPHHPQNSEEFPEPTRVKITEAEPLKSEPRLCPECHHKYLPNQCFCGICGSPLKGSTGQSVRPESPAIDLPRATANDPLFSGSIPNSVSKHAETDVQWLREKTLAELGIEAGKPRSFGKSVAVILVFLLLLFFYVQWRSQSTVNPTSRSTSNSPAPVSSAPRPNSQTAPAQVPANKTQSKTASPPASQLQKTDEGNSANAEANPSRTTSAAQSESRIVKPAEHNPPSLAKEMQNGTSYENGAQELTAAQKYLESESSSRDTAEAARWLWKAVRKQNTTALLLLADLYQHGDGVPKSCDQAQVLLVAAARKGSADAANKLRNLQSSGCK